MARTWATDVQNAMNSGLLSTAWLLELTTDEDVLRTNDRSLEITHDSNTYEPSFHKWSVEGEISTGVNLVPEPLTLRFDGADQYVEGSFLERLLDRTWAQRGMKLTGLLLNTETKVVIGEFMVWTGRMDTLEFSEQPGGESLAVLTCEGGPFRVLGRNMTTASHADQQRRNPNDLLFKNQASKVGRRMPFGVKQVDVPGSNTGGGGGGGGGGGNFSFPTFRF
ncbi:MAG: hypothetical protein AAFY12_11900 [Pseudomonadota bacterium]